MKKITLTIDGKEQTFTEGSVVEVECNDGKHIVGYLTEYTDTTKVCLARYKKGILTWLSEPVKTIYIKRIKELD